MIDWRETALDWGFDVNWEDPDYDEPPMLEPADIDPELAVKLLASIPRDDAEKAHEIADLILLRVLKHLGHSEVSKAFCEAKDRVHFLYS